MRSPLRTHLFSHVVPLLVTAGVGAAVFTAPQPEHEPASTGIAPADAATVTISATLTDDFANDVGNEGVANPGDTLRYTLTITNSGSSDAEGVDFPITFDVNTSLVPGSIQSTPLARNDTYTSLGNVGISVPLASGLLDNDFDPDGTGLAGTPISAFDATSANGGSVSVNTSDGSFTYTPAAGFTGSDTFTYTIDDGEGNSDVGTATITVADVIWFIDNSDAGSNTGTLADPFQTIGAFNASVAVAAGDDIFIEETGTGYTAGIVLKNDQQLVGEGASGVSLDAVLGLTLPTHSVALPAIAGSKPVLSNAAGAGITLAQNNTVRGLVIGNTSGDGISGSGIGTFTTTGVGITGTGQALDLDNGTLAATFDSLSTTSAAGTGIDLSLLSGTFSVTGRTTLSGVAGPGINIINSGATFSFAGLNITTTGSGTALSALSGVVNVTGSGNTITTSAGTGTAVNLTNSTIGASGITFESINVNGAPNGIVLNNTGTTGGFTITGDGSDSSLGGNASGGTLQNTTGTAVDLDATHSFNASSLTIQTPGGDGLNGLNITGTNSLKHVTITDIDASNTSAVHLKNTTASLSDFTVERSKFTDATSGQTMFLVEGGGSVTMQVQVDSSEFSNLSPAAFQSSSGLVGGDTPTVRTFLTDNDVINAKPLGISEVTLAKTQGGSLEFVVEDNTITNVGLAPVTNGILNIGILGAQSGGTLTGIVKGNSITNIPGKLRAINVVAEASSGQPGHIDLTFDNNIIDNLNGLNGATALYIDLRTDEPTADIRVINNTIGGTDASEIGGFVDGVYIEQDGAFNNTMNLLFADNTVNVSTIAQLVEIKADDSGARLNATVRGNAFNNSGSGDALVQSDVPGSVVCLDLNSAGTDDNSGNQDFDVTMLPGAGFETEGTSGAPSVVETFFDGQNSINVVVTGFTDFTGATCTEPAAVPTIAPTAPDSDLPPAEVGNRVFDRHDRLRAPIVTVSSAQQVLSNPSPFPVGTLGAGKTITFVFDLAVNDPLTSPASLICQQGAVTGTNFSDVNSDDPDIGGGADATCITLEQSLPVEMTEFAAVVDALSVILNWTTATETNNAGFQIEQRCVSCQELGSTDADDEGWIEVGFVDGNGNTTEPRTYSFVVGELDPGRHAFRLKQVDFDGAFEYSDVVEAVVEVPGEFVLEEAYPNPFNPSANIRFALAESQHTTIRMYDLRGQHVRTLYDGVASDGSMHTVRIDGAGLASGAYIVRMETEGFAESRSVVLLK